MTPNEQPNLLKTITDWIYQNGGFKVLHDVIISENHDIYQKKAVDADNRLKKRGILSYEDLKPESSNRKTAYYHNAIKYMYPHYTSPQIGEILGRSRYYVNTVVTILIRKGEITYIKKSYPDWTEEELQYIRDFGHRLNNKEIGKYLDRTANAVGQARTKLGVPMEDEFKNLSGRKSHKHYLERK